MRYKLDVIATNGVPFRVVYLPADTPSEHYPAEHEDARGRSRVEFYDRRYDHTPDGQFTGGRYYVEDILDRRYNALMLVADIHQWTVDAGTVRFVQAWIARLEMRPARLAHR